MNLLKLLGIAGAVGAGVGIYVSGVVREKFGLSGGEKSKRVNAKKVQVIEIDSEDEIIKAQVLVRKRDAE